MLTFFTIIGSVIVVQLTNGNRSVTMFVLYIFKNRSISEL